MIKNYSNFITESIISKDNEKIMFIMSDKLVHVFKKISEMDISGPLAKKLLRLNYTFVPSTISYLDIEDYKSVSFLKHDQLEIDDHTDDDIFIDSSEYQKIIHKYKNKSNSIKIGRLLLKLIELYEFKFLQKISYLPSTIEKFTNDYKALVNIEEGKLDNIKVVPASEIPKYYLYSNYSSSKGTLGSSCMRSTEAQDYMDFYTENPQAVSLVIYLDEKGKLLGRALLWNLTDGNKFGNKFMDRIYTVNDYDVNLFIIWAKKNKIIIKEDQNSLFNTNLYHPNNNYRKAEKITLNVNLNPIKHAKRHLYQFPYLDTLKYFYWMDGLLSNKASHYKSYISLDNTDGEFNCIECDGVGLNDCDYCHGEKVGCLSCNETGFLTCSTCGNFINKKSS
jgi:hypothetical protein